MDNLLSLIEKGDLDAIFSDDEHLLQLNELIKYELVVVKGEAVILSEKGQEAKKIGVEKALKRAEFNRSRDLQNGMTFKQRKDSWFLSFLILVIFFSLFLLAT